MSTETDLLKVLKAAEDLSTYDLLDLIDALYEIASLRGYEFNHGAGEWQQREKAK